MNGNPVLKIPEQLGDRQQVVIDSNIFIYLLEDHDLFGESADFIISQAESGAFGGCITPVSVAEIVVKPLRQGRSDLVDKFRKLMQQWSNIVSVDIGIEIGTFAGALRAKYGLPLPDMIQAAVALQAREPTLITNDKALKRVNELDVFTIDDFY